MAEPDWSLYRTFLAVLRDGSLSGAARRLGLAQPTIGRQLDALEADLGAPLFVRSQRGLVATELAIGLAPHAEALEAGAAALLRAASSSTDAVEGTVRVSASEIVATEHLPPLLALLRRGYPRLVVELVASDAADDLLRRDADVAVRMFPPTQGALVARKLTPIPLGLYAHRDYLARRGWPHSLRDLADHDLIGFDRETPALRAYVERVPDFSRARFALRSDSNVVQLRAIISGFGIGACQVPLARRDPALVRVLAQEFAFDLGLWIVMHEDLRASPRCRAVFDALVAGLAGLGGEA